MNWSDELAAMLAESRGDLACFVGLVSLRLVENGGEGREFGVIEPPAPLYAQQLHIAKHSFQNHEHRCALLMPIRDPVTGLYRDEFLRAFSAHWAPIGVENDPHNLNVNHAPNLVATYHKFSSI